MPSCCNSTFDLLKLARSEEGVNHRLGYRRSYSISSSVFELYRPPLRRTARTVFLVRLLDRALNSAFRHHPFGRPPCLCALAGTLGRVVVGAPGSWFGRWADRS
jgi:hypothetical protein